MMGVGLNFELEVLWTSTILADSSFWRPYPVKFGVITSLRLCSEKRFDLNDEKTRRHPELFRARRSQEVEHSCRPPPYCELGGKQRA
jgi:hypothetical protein